MATPKKTPKQLTRAALLRDVSKKMRQAGLTLDTPGRRISAGINVAIGLPSDRTTGVVQLWAAATSEYTLSVIGEPNAEQRQVVLRLQEPVRDVSKEFKWSEINARSKRGLQFWRSRFRREVMLPDVEGIKYSHKYLEDVKPDQHDHGVNYRYFQHHVEVTAKVPATDIYFLVGFDEDHTFICMLPQPATSVEDAHQLLMPTEVKKALLNGLEVLRSGELYLVEATEKEDQLLTDHIQKTIVEGGTRYRPGKSNFKFTYQGEVKACDHIPFSRVTLDGKCFVSGGMGNARHFVAFDGWYRVVPNTEVPPPKQTAKRVTWD
jgi:hypothetical protein